MEENTDSLLMKKKKIAYILKISKEIQEWSTQIRENTSTWTSKEVKYTIITYNYGRQKEMAMYIALML
jgi:hypothetical protein